MPSNYTKRPKFLPKVSFQLYNKTKNYLLITPKVPSKSFLPIIQQDKKCLPITPKYQKCPSKSFLPNIQQDKKISSNYTLDNNSISRITERNKITRYTTFYPGKPSWGRKPSKNFLI
jgi:hypothetical protein